METKVQQLSTTDFVLIIVYSEDYDSLTLNTVFSKGIKYRFFKELLQNQTSLMIGGSLDIKKTDKNNNKI